MEKEKVIEDDPAVEARVQRGIRYVTSFGMANGRKERTVPYKHVKDSSRSGTPKKKGKGKGSGRSVSPTRKSKGEMAKISCTYFQQGKCRRGDK